MPRNTQLRVSGYLSHNHRLFRRELGFKFVIQITFHFCYRRIWSMVVTPPGAFMNNFKSLRETDLEKLGRLSIFSWLTPAEVRVLGTSLEILNYKRREVIFQKSPLANEAHVLIAGIARLTCLN